MLLKKAPALLQISLDRYERFATAHAVQAYRLSEFCIYAIFYIFKTLKRIICAFKCALDCAKRLPTESSIESL